MAGEGSQSHPKLAGSSSGEPVFLAIGTIGRLHGVKDELLFYIVTDFPERIKKGMLVYLGSDYKPVHIQERRWNGKNLLLRFEGYDTPELAGSLRNQVVYVSGEDLPPLSEGEYYHHQVIGLRVIEESGESLGMITEILETGANDVYVVTSENRPEILLPAIEDVILNVDLVEGIMRVHLLPGLLG